MSQYFFATAIVTLSLAPALAEPLNSQTTSIKPKILSEASWSLSIGYAPISSSFLQNQNLGDSRVDVIDTNSTVSNNEVSLRLMKEFFSEKRVSLSALGNLAYLKGSSRNQTDKNLKYAQRAEGYQLGAGVSVNLNFYAMGFGLQPFFSTEINTEDNKYELDYSSNGLPVILGTQLRRTQIVPSLGVRVFDPQTSLMSFLSVGFNQVLSESITSNVDINRDGFRSTGNPGNVEISDLILRLGIGVFF